MGEVVMLEREEPQADFESFWIMYPRKIAKKDARKAWDRIDRNAYITILESLYHWRRAWKDTDPEFIPHPATWLNGERWEDELPNDSRPMHASHVPIAPVNWSRSEMPQYVKDLLLKLRK